jgi:hypothetical protein
LSRQFWSFVAATLGRDSEPLLCREDTIVYRKRGLGGTIIN